MSKVLAASHETVRRARRGELVYAQTLLEELRFFVMRLDVCLHHADPSTPADFKVERRLTASLQQALRQSYVELDPTAIETAAVRLATWFAGHLAALHQAFALARSLPNDQEAAATSPGPRQAPARVGSGRQERAAGALSYQRGCAMSVASGSGQAYRFDSWQRML